MSEGDFSTLLGSLGDKRSAAIISRNIIYLESVMEQ